MTDIPDKRYYLPEELAKIMRVKVETVRRWIRQERVLHVHLPKGTRIEKDEFVFVQKHGPRPRPL
jgi:hypothetical protein